MPAEPTLDRAPAAGPKAGGGFIGEGDHIAPMADALKSILQSDITPEQFQTWFKRSKLVRIDDEAATIAVPNSFAREWINRYYLDVLERAVGKLLGQKRRVIVVEQPESLVEKTPEPAQSEPNPAQPNPAGPNPARRAPSPGSQSPQDRNGQPDLTGVARSDAPPAERHRHAAKPIRRGVIGQLESSSDFVLNQKCTFDNFVVGPCNRFGHAASMGAAEQPGKSYNPLFLHGRVGVGKTHLLQAFCFSVLERFPESRILYLSCETFVNHFISALDAGDMQRFRDKYRDIDVLVIDDIQTLANKEKSQEEFFHTFNSLYNAGKQIVLSADCPPKDIPTLHDRLVSRFKWGMVTEIEPPCYETRMAIVKRKSRERGDEVPDEIAQFIAENIEENVRELEGAVTRLIGYSRMTGAEMSLELAREALAGLIEVRKGAPTVEDIINQVTDHYQVKLSDLQSRRRTKAIAFPRQVAMYLARKVTRHSLEEIGGFFGGRDHTTVIYAVDKMEKLIVSDPAFSKDIQQFMDRLGHSSRSN
ncbi:MAG: chromosomal replication initiator protein [Planctomycetota bacterium]|jgi:chromosomal replication initiator protein